MDQPPNPSNGRLMSGPADRARFAALAYLGTGGVAAAIIVVALVLSPPGSILRGPIGPFDLLTGVGPEQIAEVSTASDLAESVPSLPAPELAVAPSSDEIASLGGEAPILDGDGQPAFLAAASPILMNPGANGGPSAIPFGVESDLAAQEIAVVESEAPLAMSIVDIPPGVVELAEAPGVTGPSFGEARALALAAAAQPSVTTAEALAPTSATASPARSTGAPSSRSGLSVALAPPPLSALAAPPVGLNDVYASSVLAPSVSAPSAISPPNAGGFLGESGVSATPAASASASSPPSATVASRPHIGGGSNASMSTASVSSASVAVAGPNLSAASAAHVSSAPAAAISTNVQISAPSIGGASAAAPSVISAADVSAAKVSAAAASTSH